MLVIPYKMNNKTVEIELTDEVLEIIQDHIRNGDELFELPIGKHSATPRKNGSYSIQYEKPLSYAVVNVNNMVLNYPGYISGRLFKHSIDFIRFCKLNKDKTISVGGVGCYSDCEDKIYFRNMVDITVIEK